MRPLNLYKDLRNNEIILTQNTVKLDYESVRHFFTIQKCQ